MEDKLYIKTLGEFSISYQDIILTNQDNRSKKTWMLLAYIITYHEKEIAQSTLIDLLWSEDNISSDPENALKTSLHRIRALLDQLKHPIEKLILHKQNTFRFNKEVLLVIDVELFEQYYTLAQCSEIEEEKIVYYKKALELYKGDFLPKYSEEDWAVPITIYYHSMYLKMVQEYLTILLHRKQYEDMVNLCYLATAIDSYDETIQYHFILSLYLCGKQQAAIAQYNTCINMYYSNFGVDPSDQMLNLYKEIIKTKKSPQIDLNLIQEDLMEKDSQKKAYSCDYSIFQHMYQIQARSMERTGLCFFLCLFTLDTDNSKHKQTLTLAMNRLEEIIGNSLRQGDTYARYSVNQYIVLLPSTCYENSITVGERILRNFSNLKPKLSAKLSYHLKHMNPKNFNVAQ